MNIGAWNLVIIQIGLFLLVETNSYKLYNFFLRKVGMMGEWNDGFKNISFTPLESPVACSGDKDEFLLKRTRGLMPRVSRPVRRAKVF